MMPVGLCKFHNTNKQHPFECGAVWGQNLLGVEVNQSLDDDDADDNKPS